MQNTAATRVALRSTAVASSPAVMLFGFGGDKKSSPKKAAKKAVKKTVRTTQIDLHFRAQHPETNRGKAHATAHVAGQEGGQEGR